MAAAIKSNDSAYAWSRRFPPIPVLSNVKFADAGINMVAFIQFDGSLWLTYEDTNSLKTRSLPMIANPVRVGVGYGVVYVLSSDGQVYCIENPTSNPTVVLKTFIKTSMSQVKQMNLMNNWQKQEGLPTF